jgi:hypothetical protein
LPPATSAATSGVDVHVAGRQQVYERGLWAVAVDEPPVVASADLALQEGQ